MMHAGDRETVLAIGCCIVALSLLVKAGCFIRTPRFWRISSDWLVGLGLVVCGVLPCVLPALLLLGVFAEAVAGSGST